MLTHLIHPTTSDLRSTKNIRLINGMQYIIRANYKMDIKRREYIASNFN
jgi:hypothetical protein